MQNENSEVMVKANRTNYQVVLVHAGQILRTMPGVCQTFAAAREAAEMWALRNSYYARRSPLVWEAAK